MFTVDYIISRKVLSTQHSHHVCSMRRRPRQEKLPWSFFRTGNTLKVVLCLTPVLFLFLLNTASDLSESEEYRELASQFSIQITIDLFDGVEMLDVVLDERENSHGISKEFGIAMIVVACFGFTLSLLQMAEYKLDDGHYQLRKKLSIVRNVMQLSLVNLVFLIIRLVIFIKYKKDESIFIAKNGIAIFLSSLEIYWIRNAESAD